MAQPILAIANRAEIAVRIARTARALGWQPVALLGEPDWDGFAAREIGNVVRLESGQEFDVDAVIRAASTAGATALHPGYGFLSERPDLSRACLEAGITFIGPAPKTLELAGDKIATRDIASQQGVPVVAGSAALDLAENDSWHTVAAELGYPVIAKVASAGGGRGLRVARDPDQLVAAIQSALNEAGGSGAAHEIFLEHYLEGARHVEVQVAGDGERAIVIGDRDCSLQRRHQKIVEEAPAPGLSNTLRGEIHVAARKMAEGVGLLNLATVEFLVGRDERFFFMEINPRLQVEHTVTEEVCGLDLVALQLKLAAGGDLPNGVTQQGHAIQARLYAEDPFQQFLPSPGFIRALEFPQSTGRPAATLRVDAGYAAGDTVTGNYDPMIAKLIVHAPNRAGAIDALAIALTDLQIAGVATNRPWLLAALAEGSAFHSNDHDLTTASEIVLEPGPPSDEALAALTVMPTSGAISRASAWDLSGPFRIVAPATATFHGDEGAGWQKTVALGAASEAEPESSLLVLEDASGWEVVTAEGRWLINPGPAPTAGHTAGAGDGTVRAPMPGKILQVYAQPGQKVEADEVLAVMEAMKIELSLAAPFAGTVASVSVAAGDLVGLRQGIATIEALESGGDSE